MTIRSVCLLDIPTKMKRIHVVNEEIPDNCALSVCSSRCSSTSLHQKPSFVESSPSIELRNLDTLAWVNDADAFMYYNELTKLFIQENKSFCIHPEDTSLSPINIHDFKAIVAFQRVYANFYKTCPVIETFKDNMTNFQKAERCAMVVATFVLAVQSNGDKMQAYVEKQRALSIFRAMHSDDYNVTLYTFTGKFENGHIREILYCLIPHDLIHFQLREQANILEQYLDHAKSEMDKNGFSLISESISYEMSRVVCCAIHKSPVMPINPIANMVVQLTLLRINEEIMI